MMLWREILAAVEAQGRCALVSIIAVDGSAPREAGSRMIVSDRGFHGSIGGGALEWQALALAQSKLLGEPGTTVTRHNLGPDLGQCCGGRVGLATEVFTNAQLSFLRSMAAREAAGPFTMRGRILGKDFEEHFGEQRRTLALFGAGHVGRALILALAGQPFSIRWIDPRPAAFPSVTPGDVENIITADPPSEIGRLQTGSFVLAMTHSHSLDLAIADQALRRTDLAFIGVIGSETKRARFISRLQAAGVDTARLTCPIGIEGIRSKRPAAIALSVASQLLVQDELWRSKSHLLDASRHSAKPKSGGGMG